MRAIILFSAVGLGSAFGPCSRAGALRYQGIQGKRNRQLDRPRTVSLHRNFNGVGNLEGGKNDDDGPDQLQIIEGEAAEEYLDEETIADIEAGQPPEWMVMKELLGINIFTYVLAAAIVFFLSMNAILGPGWLGNQFGIVSGWDATQTSDSLPEMIDLSSPEYLL